MKRAEITGRLVRRLNFKQADWSPVTKLDPEVTYMPWEDKLWPNERSVNGDHKRQWFSFTSFVACRSTDPWRFTLKLPCKEAFGETHFWQGRKEGRKDEWGEEKELGMVTWYSVGRFQQIHSLSVFGIYDQIAPPPPPAPACESPPF